MQKHQVSREWKCTLVSKENEAEYSKKNPSVTTDKSINIKVKCARKFKGSLRTGRKKNSYENRAFLPLNKEQGRKWLQNCLISQRNNQRTRTNLSNLFKVYSSNFFCSLAQMVYFVSALSINPSQTSSLVIDSRATEHMTSCSELFSAFTPCAGNKKSRLLMGLSRELLGPDPLCYPSITCMMSFMSLNSLVIFCPSWCPSCLL